MLPTLKSGQVVLVRKNSSKLKKGDIVVFRHDNMEKIKRVVKISEKGLYVVGDNLSASTDSRHFGLVQRGEILGKVMSLNLFKKQT